MTAREKLSQMMEEEKWYDGIFHPATARSLKRHLLSGKNISDKKVRSMLLKLGCKPTIKSIVTDVEVWE